MERLCRTVFFDSLIAAGLAFLYSYPASDAPLSQIEEMTFKFSQRLGKG